MKDNLEDTLLNIYKLLQKYKVDYLLIGGTAVALNGYYRHSVRVDGNLTGKPDVDIWYNPTYENYFNLLKTLKDLGHDITEFENEQSPDPRKSFFKLEFADFTLDVLPKIKAEIKFTDAYKRREIIESNDIEIHYLSYSDLIDDKNTNPREKDIIDIQQLKKNKNGYKWNPFG